MRRYALMEPLRGLAALWVFGFHYHFSEAFQETFPQLHALLRAGHLGVPMFFVLSGYCITASARRSLDHHEGAGRFLYRRLRRIYPPFWFSLLVVVSVPFVIEWLSFLKTGRYVPPSADVLNYGFLNYSLTDWLLAATLLQVFAPVADAGSLQYKFTTLNAVYWTLALEVQFYLVTALAVYLRHYYPVMLAVTVVSFASLWVPAIWVTGIFLPYWPLFALGVLLYWVLERGMAPSELLPRSFLPVVWWALLGLMGGVVFALLQDWPHDFFAFAAVFTLALYLGESLDQPFVEQILSSRRFPLPQIAQATMVVGGMSYSLYLLHGRLQFLSMQVVRQVLPTNSILYDLAVLAITCGGCFVFYLFCEHPFLSSRQSAETVSLRSRCPGLAEHASVTEPSEDESSSKVFFREAVSKS